MRFTATSQKQGGFAEVAIVVGIILILAAGGVLVLLQGDSDIDYSPNNGSSSIDGLGPKPTETSLSSFESQEIGYECSKKVEGDWVVIRGQIGQEKWTFVPTNQADIERYCRTTYAIEYDAVIRILQRPDVAEVIEAYDPSEAWVKVLNYQLIEDRQYLERILPNYNDINIHCIVVVHSPEGQRFFLEDDDQDDRFIEVDSTEFLASLNRATDDDVNAFWLHLR